MAGEILGNRHEFQPAICRNPMIEWKIGRIKCSCRKKIYNKIESFRELLILPPVTLSTRFAHEISRYSYCCFK